MTNLNQCRSNIKSYLNKLNLNYYTFPGVFKTERINIVMNEIEKEVKQATKELNLNAPYADVDSEAADVPESVVKDL